MNLAAAILQMAMTIVSMVQANPGMPQWQRDQALSIANQSVQFANQTLQQSGYQNCQYPYNYSNCSGYNPGYQNPATGVQLFVLDSVNSDVSWVRNSQAYTIMWTPFNQSQGSAVVQLYNSSTGMTTFVANASTNSVVWMANASTGSYQLRILQGGAVIASRTITVQ